MDPATESLQTIEDRRRGRTEAIKQFLGKYAPCEDEDLLAQMLVTICRMAADGTDRGDLKLLTHALKELRYAFKVFAPYSEIPKVSIFGSSRTPEDHPQFLQARKFAELIQRAGWMVITGAGGGIMHAGHHGATRKSSFGVAISLPFEQETNEVIANDPKLVNFKYFFTRKLVFVKEARAIVLFPGGFGTQDEGFESLTLVQTAKTLPVPVVLCDEPGGTYWQTWREFVVAELLGNGMIDEADMGLFDITDSAEQAVDIVTKFYRRYHSSRFVGDKLVLRLHTPLSTKTVDALNSEYGDILLRDDFRQQAGPLDGENDEYPDKARLVFTFDRRSAGRLRQLMNVINEAK